MQKDVALSFLSSNLSIMTEKFDVNKLALFGSTARDEAEPDSDVDILVEFKGPGTFDHFMGLANFLEKNLKTKVDLVTFKSIRKELKESIMEDVIYVS